MRKLALTLLLIPSAAAAQEVAVQPQVAANVATVGWNQVGPFVPSVAFAPSVRVGPEWPGFGLYGHLAYASAFGFVGGYNGTQLVTLGPDVELAVAQKGDVRGYLAFGVNGGVAILTTPITNDTAAHGAFGFLAAAGIRDMASRLRPALELGTRTELVKDNDWIGTSSIYLAVNCEFGGQTQEKAKPTEPAKEPPKTPETKPEEKPVVAAAPPACPDKRKEAEAAEDEARRLGREIASLGKDLDKATAAVAKWRADHEGQDRTEALNAEEKALTDAGGAIDTKIQQKKEERQKAEDAAKAARAICDPVIQQPSDTTCGPASVRMIVSTYGKGEPSIDDVCKAVPGTYTTKNGTEVKETPKILAHYGIDAKLEDHATINTLDKATAGGHPAITVVDQGGTKHAVVVDRVIDNGDGTKDVTGRDPLKGKPFTVSAKEFDDWWRSKVMITTTPPAPPK